MTDVIVRSAILDDWAAGLSSGEIAKKYGAASAAAVIGIVDRARRAGDPRAVKRNAAVRVEIAKANLGGRALMRAGDFTAADDAYIRERAGSDTTREIAAVLGRDAQQIRRRASYMGVSLENKSTSVTRISCDPVPTPAPDVHPVPFLDLRSCQCRYALFTGRPPVEEMLFCGAPTASPKLSWCSHHLQRVSARPTGSLTDARMRAAEIAA